MGFKISSGNPQVFETWRHVDYSTAGVTAYVGQLVKTTGDGVGVIAVASGAPDASGDQNIDGVITGTNNLTALFDATYKAQYVTSVTAQASQVARECAFMQGDVIGGEKAAMVKVAAITPDTILEAPLYNAAYGTAPTVLTVTTGSTTGAGFTSNATQFTPVADLAIAYCRTGANAGLFRVTTDTSTTVCTSALYWPYDIAVGDTFIRVPIRKGWSYAYIDAAGMYIDASASPATNYFLINVLELVDFDKPGKERVRFRFAPRHLGVPAV